jgi:hypothetical protein
MSDSSKDGKAEEQIQYQVYRADYKGKIHNFVCLATTFLVQDRCTDRMMSVIGQDVTTSAAQNTGKPDSPRVRSEPTNSYMVTEACLIYIWRR